MDIGRIAVVLGTTLVVVGLAAFGVVRQGDAQSQDSRREASKQPAYETELPSLSSVGGARALAPVEDSSLRLEPTEVSTPRVRWPESFADMDASIVHYMQRLQTASTLDEQITFADLVTNCAICVIAHAEGHSSACGPARRRAIDPNQSPRVIMHEGITYRYAMAAYPEKQEIFDLMLLSEDDPSRLPARISPELTESLVTLGQRARTLLQTW